MSRAVAANHSFGNESSGEAMGTERLGVRSEEVSKKILVLVLVLVLVFRKATHPPIQLCCHNARDAVMAVTVSAANLSALAMISASAIFAMRVRSRTW
eukprot:scaffold516_cov270-Pinguiococcus_pyrenoidosus.AAC.9